MRRRIPKFALLVPALALLALTAARSAAALTTSCVNTSTLLQNALVAAQSNHDDNYIKIVASSYGIAAPISIAIPAGYSLTVEGGYTSGCGSAPISTPYVTTITGGSGVSFKIVVADSDLTIRNLTFTGFQPPAGNQAIGFHQYGSDARLHVENVNVTGNTVGSSTDDILIVDSLGSLVLDDNIVHDNANARYAVHVFGNNPASPFVIANNTVVKNAGQGLFFDVQTFLPSGLYNNILWQNGGNDLTVGSVVADTPALALNNIWLNCNNCGALAQASANNSTSDPVLTSNYRLANGSPAINAGVPLPMVLPATDAANATRVVGSAPDLGAFESTTDDLGANQYVVSNSGDDATNVQTLRGAITAANAAGVPALISLQYSSGCPTEVDLSTPLPAITVSMVIDGYADPNSAVNTAPKNGSLIPFNATLCTILFNTGPASNNAFTVASSVPANRHLEVRGVRFSNFNDAVSLGGGNGHWIHGNAFSLYGTLGNNIGVSISGGHSDVIGGPATADVNLIGASNGSVGTGIVVQSTSGFHNIVNNNIGGNPPADTSTTAYGNAQNGIWLLDASRDTVTGNLIEFNRANGILLSDASYSVIAENAILLGGDVSSGFVGVVPGVRISNGAANNWVGNTGSLGIFSPSGSNTIAFNSGPGVWIDTTASYNNQVVGNQITSNLGMSIDLAAQGPTANAGNEASGPNFLLHKPVITSADDSGSGTVLVTGTIPTESAGISRLLTLYASPGCGGQADEMIQTFSVSSGSDSIVHFSVTVAKPSSPLIYINASEEGPYTGPTNTSEISNTRLIMPKDDIFYDEFDCY